LVPAARTCVLYKTRSIYKGELSVLEKHAGTTRLELACVCRQRLALSVPVGRSWATTCNLSWYRFSIAAQMTLDELKAFGAPWPAAEVQISVQKKITRFVFLVRDGDGFRAFDDFALELPWPANEDFHNADTLANAVLALAKELQLLT
jgi:hypothetical protein